MMKVSFPHVAGGALLVAVGAIAGWVGRGIVAPNRAGLDRPKPPEVASISLQSTVANATLDKAATTDEKESVWDKVAKGAFGENFFFDEPGLFSEYLLRHQRNAASLLAVWQINGDESLLREAYEKDPSHLGVAAAALETLRLSAEEKKALLDRMARDHPQNALVPLIAASLAIQAGAFEESITKLREALARPVYDLELNTQLLAQREAFMSIGKSPLEARVASFSRAPTHGLTASMRGNVSFRRYIEKLVAENRIDDAIALAGDMLAASRKVMQEPSRFAQVEMFGGLMETAALHALPPDVEVGDTGLTAAGYLENRESVGGMSYQELGWHMDRLDEGKLAMYFDIIEQRGEREAQNWVETLNGPAPQKAKNESQK